MNLVETDVRDAFFDQIYALAEKDQNLVFITADADAFSLRKFKNDFPDRFINVGVAEQNMVLVATGLALCGKSVFIYSIIPFITQRSLEHIKVNICSMNLPVTIVGSGAGLSFAFDGPTHHATQDIAAMKSLPEMTILSPSDSQSSHFSAMAAYESETPVYVRLDKGKFPEIYKADDDFGEGAKYLIRGQDIILITTGFMTQRALDISLKLKEHGLNVGVVDISRIKPLNEKLLASVLSDAKIVYTLEEHSIIGGLGTSISELISDHGIDVKLNRISLPDKQIFDYGDRDWLHSLYGLDKDSLVKSLLTIKGSSPK